MIVCDGQTQTVAGLAPQGVYEVRVLEFSNVTMRLSETVTAPLYNPGRWLRVCVCVRKRVSVRVYVRVYLLFPREKILKLQILLPL